MAGTFSVEVDFSRYLAQLKNHFNQVQAMAVFNADSELLWRSGDFDEARVVETQSKAGEFLLDQLNSVTRPRLQYEGGGRFTELVILQGKYQKPLLLLAIDLKPLNQSDNNFVSEQDAVDLLNVGLAKEYLQSLSIAEKEEELNAMTEELTRRYEELNLLYQADDQTQNLYHGDALLSQLVTHTLDFLEVDLVYLALPEKNVSLHRFSDEKVGEDSAAIFSGLREEVFPILGKDGVPVVINNGEDASQLGVFEDVPYKCANCAIVNAENRVIGLLSIVNRNFNVDFTNSDRNLLEVLAKKASKIVQFNFDPLTGLENSHSFSLIIKDALRRSWKSETSHAIANIDINRMAVINDISGLEAGDELIRKVGQTISGMVRSRDVVARLGSDKFGVYLENCDLKTATLVLEKIAEQIASSDFEWEGELHEISVSVGIAPITPASRTVTSLLNAAESARVASKEHGRSKIQVFEAGHSDLLRRQQQIRAVGKIQQALRADRFALYAQPIESLDPDDDSVHFEILLRMLDEGGRIVMPGDFLPAAETFFLMPKIDRWVIENTFATLSNWSNSLQQHNYIVSINLAGQSLSDVHELEHFIRQKLDEYQIDARTICFEVTESSAIASLEEAQLFIEKISSLGCTFSLDDFGTGLSSFAYLKTLKVDYLKIDGVFVRDLIDDPVAQSMVAAINQVGQTMGMKTIAEFVENDEIYEKLREIGVDFGQGYGIGKPEPVEQQFEKLCRLAIAE